MPELPAIAIRGVSKRLKGVEILRDCALEVPYGRLVTILGPNGSGKTLLLRILSGLVYADRGTVHVGGVHLRKSWSGPLPTDTGVLIEAPGFLPYLSGRENLELLARLRGRIGSGEVADAMRQVGLDPGHKKPVRAYSLGMRQRLGIAQAWMERPRILLLDEPTNALDPDFVPTLVVELRRLADAGCAVVVTTHDIALLPTISDEVFALRDGRLAPTDGTS